MPSTLSSCVLNRIHAPSDATQMPSHGPADVRVIYYAVLGLVVVWGSVALQLPPFALLTMGANIAGAIFVFASLHLLYLNTRVLPVELRPPMWRRISLVAMSLFYAFFVALVARSLF